VQDASDIDTRDSANLKMSTLALTGKSALVTGGARRIGRAIALRLAGAGADVSITYRNSAADAEQTIRQIRDLGRTAQAIQCDVRSEQDIREAVAKTASQHGRIDILVNNAAIYEGAALDQMTLEQWDRMFETNARGPFLFAREAISHLRAVRGRIINLGSLGGINPWPTHGHYCASKAAVHMLSEVMAKAFAPEVAVNCVAPGWIDQNDKGEEMAAHYAAKTPMRRNGTADDIADAVLFFAAHASFVTGQTLVVDGGLSL
jgi:NAD(P)-dependent dehydrogenase (short-subunit alcohol dehydrogenase family)